MITRKIINFGTHSKGVILPKSWITIMEKRIGKFDSVLIEFSSEGSLITTSLVITPIQKD